MEIKRKIYSKIVEWKETSQGKKALLIEGARRIGKSTVAEEIGKKNINPISWWILTMRLQEHLMHLII